jgi:hypothetical protein
MKIDNVLLSALAATLMLLGASTASADPFDDVTGYGTLGFGDAQTREVSLDEVTGRLGARFGSYFGVEGEANIGLNRENFVYGPSCARGVICPLFIGLGKIRLGDAEAAYAVGFLPIAPNADLFARVGYGISHFDMQPSFLGPNRQGVNFGAGAQYFFDDVNGVRFDYTRTEFNTSGFFGRNVLGSGANVFSIAYTRKFD